jgi:hypothetical protein
MKPFEHDRGSHRAGNVKWLCAELLHENRNAGAKQQRNGNIIKYYLVKPRPFKGSSAPQMRRPTVAWSAAEVRAKDVHRRLK